MLGLAAAKAAAYLAGAVVATTVLVHDGRAYQPQPYTRWLSTFAVPGPPGYVDFGIGGCDDAAELGCMTWQRPMAVVRITRADRRDEFTFAHELGHVFDFYVLDPLGWRPRFAALEGFGWRTPRSEEFFADSYALCALHRRLAHTVVTGYGFRVSPELHQQICALIRDAYVSWLAAPPLNVPGQVLPLLPA